MRAPRRADEEVLPEAELRVLCDQLLAPAYELIIIKRKGRSERVTILVDGARISTTYKNTEPGAARLGMKRFLEDLARAGSEARAQAERSK